MTLRERIVELVTSVPKWRLCAACIQKGLAMTTSHGINRATLLLTTEGFVRELGLCTACGEPRVVIYADFP